MSDCFAGDSVHLASFEQRLQLIRDRVQGVAEGYGTGLYIWGKGGTSKSHTVEQALKLIHKPFKPSNSRLTARGLFDLLQEHHDIVHVIEDVESLFADKSASEVLRSATWGQTNESGRQERLVVWQTARAREEVIFTGRIIMMANRPLGNADEVQALKTRVTVMHHEPTAEEIAAMMRKVAGQGFRHELGELSPAESLEVAEEIMARSHKLQRPLDLRMLVGALQDRLQWANGASETHWRDLLDTRIKERTTLGDYKSRSMRKEDEIALARRIARLPRQERLETWSKETGKSEKALYRRLKELEAGCSHYSHFPRFPRDQRWNEN